MSTDWIVARVAEAVSALEAKGSNIPPQVVQEFTSLLHDELQTRLKPSEVKDAIVRLAKANNPAAQ